MKAYKETIRKYYKYQYSDWTQPILSANGTMGGNSYACDRDSIVHGQEAFQAFDGNNSTYWWSGAGFPHWITFYSPVQIKVTHMYMWSESNYNTQGVLQGSNDNTTWTDLISWSNAGQTKDLDIPNSNYYQYYRCYVTNGTYTHTLINTLTFTATQRTIAESSSSDYDFYEDVPVYKLPATVDRTYYKYQDWTQPILTSNGTMGGDNFACSQSSVLNSSVYVYGCFNGTSVWHSAVGLPAWVSFYNPNPLIVTNLAITNGSDSIWKAIKGGTIQGSNNGSDWVDITAFSNSNTTTNDTWNIDLSNNANAYKYYRIYITSSHYNNNGYYCVIGKIGITAKEVVYGTSSDYDTYEDKTTYYAIGE